MAFLLLDDKNDDFRSQASQMSNLDRYIFLIGGFLTALVLFLFIIISRYFRQFKRQQSNGLIIGIAVSDLLLVLSWIALAVKPTKVNDNEDFYKTIGAFGIFGALMNFLYNISFSLYLIALLRNALTQDKIPQTRFHVINLTISLVCIYFARNLIDKALEGTCSIKSACSDNLANYLVPAFALAYCILGVLTSLYVQRNSPICSRIDPKRTQFLNHYLRYNLICIFVSFIIATAKTLENLFVIPQIIKSGYSEYQWISSLSHLAKLCCPLMLAIIRFYDPQTKQNLLKTLCFWKKGRPNRDPESLLDDTRVSESDVPDVLLNIHDVFVDSRKQFAYTILSCVLYHDQYRKTMGKLPVAKIANQSPDNPFKHQEVFLIEDCNIKTHLPHVKEELERRRFNILTGTLKVYSPEIYGQILNQERDFFDISESFDFSNNLDIVESIFRMRDLFFLSKDKKLILKGVTDTEIKTLASILERSQQHFNQNPNSLISKIYGAYTYVSPELDSRINFILIKNVCGFPFKFIERAYDIKGSRFGKARWIDNNMPPNFKSVGVLYDADFQKYEQKLHISPELHKTFLDQIKRDSEFLRSVKLIDYSLEIFIVNKEQAKNEVHFSKDSTASNQLGSMENINEPGLYYNMEIIDYLQQPYNFKKKLERCVKKIKGGTNRSWWYLDPDIYSYQFIQFITQILEPNSNFTYSKNITVLNT